MNAIGLDLNAVGNHEFDRGAQELLRIVGGGCRSDTVGESVSCASPSRAYNGARFRSSRRTSMTAKAGRSSCRLWSATSTA